MRPQLPASFSFSLTIALTLTLPLTLGSTLPDQPKPYFSFRGSDHRETITSLGMYENPRPRVGGQGQGQGQGWLARFLSMGGEGIVDVLVGLTFFTRP